MTLLLAQANAQRLPMMDGSAHVCVTSVPYWGLRAYEGSQVLVWGGRGDCRHEWGEEFTARQSGGGWATENYQEKKKDFDLGERSQGQFCRHCSAWRGALGLEPLHDCLGWATGEPCGACYVCHIVEVFREVWRVLHLSGIVFLNLGDAHFSGAQHEVAYDTSDKVPGDYQGRDCLYENLCDVCRVVYQNRKSRSDHLLVAMLTASLSASTLRHTEPEPARLATLHSIHQKNRNVFSNQDHERSVSPVNAQLRASLVSMLGESFPQLLDECLQRHNHGECLLCGRLLVPESPACARMDVCPDKSDTFLSEIPLISRKEDNCPASLAYLDYTTTRLINQTLKPKNLCNIPGRVVLALQADGWTHRDTIIWAKAEVGTDTVPMFDMPVENTLEGSAMPGSQSDRCTSAYEFIFQLTKSRHYYFDQEAEKTASGAILRNVWRMNPQNYKGAHFATFCEELPRRCISLGSSERGVCPECKEPWRRVVKNAPEYQALLDKNKGINHVVGQDQEAIIGMRGQAGRKHGGISAQRITLGWIPGCNCPHYPPPARGPVECGKCGGTGRERAFPRGTEPYRAERVPDHDLKRDHDGRDFAAPVATGHPCPACSGSGTVEGDVWPDDVDDWLTVPAVVLDPFAGSCTSLLVARKLGRHGIGFDLSLEYLRDQGRKRLELNAWDAWHSGQARGDGRGDLTELPLFASVKEEG